MKSCLVVDDSKVVRLVARKILRDLDFEVSEAADGRQALRMCAASMPDAILLDWNMPVMNGIEFLTRLRRQNGGTAPVVVFCTTEDDPAHGRAALAAGASDLILKPLNVDAVAAKLARVGVA